jgi:hypothetical protein
MYRLLRAEDSADLDELRTRLREMNDVELVRFGRACSQKADTEAPNQPFIIQLEEAQAEWRRRHRSSLAQL